MQPSIKEIIDRYEPGLMDIFYPRAYQSPSTHPSVKNIAYHLCSPTLLSRPTESGDNDIFDEIARDAYVTTAKLAKLSVPTYFVSYHLIMALLASDPPKDTLLSDIPWPLDAMLFVLPLHFMNSPTDGDCPFLAVAKHTAGDIQQVPYPRAAKVGFHNETYTFMTMPIGPDSSPIFVSRVNPMRHPRFEDVIKAQPPSKFFPHTENMAVTDSVLPSGADVEFLNVLADLGLRLILYMLARPDEIEKAKLISSGITKKRKDLKEVWTPNFLGRNYSLRGLNNMDTPRHSPRMHWRRGHYRNQPYGDHMSLKRLIWIEPTIVGA